MNLSRRIATKKRVADWMGWTRRSLSEAVNGTGAETNKLKAKAPNGSAFCPLKTRGVVELSGPDAQALLQGLVTNNVQNLKAEQGGMFAAFLNAKGRMIADVILHRVAEDTFFLDLHVDNIPRIIKYLKLTKLRKDVTITDASDVYTVVGIMSPEVQALETFESSLSENPISTVIKDPRFSELGYRLFCSKKSEESLAEKLSKLGFTAASTESYEKVRMFNGVPEGKEVDGVIPLEYNIDLLNGVSFTKGCYTGQELTARTHFQGLVRKRLVPVCISGGSGAANPLESALVGSMDECLAALDFQHLELPANIEKAGMEESKSAGKLVALAKNSSIGLALLRLEDGCEGTWTAQGAFTLHGKNVRVPRFPSWWHNQTKVTPPDESEI